MTLSYEKLLANERNNAANAKVLAETLRAMRSVLIRPEDLCKNCKREPIAFAIMGGLCVECADYILE